ncbi:conjugal transfer protein TraH [Aquibium sp. ELW1220]|uniref:conjugal transfer protein TraH n=1 Tax=Aquibium sp. ELW1220 TaxID=2976766 RepID=UPI0025B26D82|nr:conjugal transfer protein TraH [Aquibium sp. ELW1220]MDN2583766.1 conjugal transfer protein TraH [Aquibium sp. ELW1220]
MLDTAFLETCADPGVRIEVVERFVSAVGTENPLAISITSGNRVILPEPPTTPEEAARLAQRFVGTAVVRAGITGFPVGAGISDASEITADIFDVCKNIGMGTALFGKVYRVVAHARRAEDGTVLRDALEAWRTGQFEGAYVFAEPDPGPLLAEADGQENFELGPEPAPAEEAAASPEPDADDPNTAGIRVMLPASIGRQDGLP